ncbi:hypothetical protein [Thalassiella azotivora]
MRYAVDPTELLAVADEVTTVRSLAGQAAERLTACSGAGWCLDEELRSAVEVALEDLAYAARQAQVGADATVAALRLAARRYQRVDLLEPQ